MKIGIFCSANDTIDPDFFRLTDELGTWIGTHGHSIVFGGCNLGLMACIARSTHAAGGRTIGVVPEIIEKNGQVSDDVDVNVACADLTDRKALIMAQADVFVALPGGIGTLDEIFTVTAAHTIGYHRKRMVLYNMKGFWNATIAMLDDMQERGLIRGKWSEFIAVANTLDEVIAALH